VKDLRQVTNYYGQHWHDVLKAIIVGPDVIYDRLSGIIGTVLDRPIMSFSAFVPEGLLPPDSCAVLGAAIRGLDVAASRKEINLLGSDANVIFQKERFIGFMDFWRVVLPVTLAFLIGVMALGDLFLSNINRMLSASSISISSVTSQELQQLTAQANAFNREVDFLSAAESSASSSRGVFLQSIVSLAATNDVTISDIKFPAVGQPLSISGLASTQNQVLLFKQALAAMTGVTNVNLPLSNIQESNGGFVFSLTFSYSFPQ
jgi:Tfp pilus assembly protein PilN